MQAEKLNLHRTGIEMSNDMVATLDWGLHLAPDVFPLFTVTLGKRGSVHTCEVLEILNAYLILKKLMMKPLCMSGTELFHS